VLRKLLICEAYWAGEEFPPEEKAMPKEALAMLDDLEGASIEDIEATEEKMHEHERDISAA